MRRLLPTDKVFTLVKIRSLRGSIIEVGDFIKGSELIRFHEENLMIADNTSLVLVGDHGNMFRISAPHCGDVYIDRVGWGYKGLEADIKKNILRCPIEMLPMRMGYSSWGNVVIAARLKGVIP